MPVQFTRSDLDFILTQIEMAEAGQDPVNPHLSFGLRQVNGQNNSVVAGQPLFGAADQAFPRMSTPVFQSADAGTNYAQTAVNPGANPNTNPVAAGVVIDADPRVISNLIADQTANNPAAVAAAAAAAAQLGDGYTHALPGLDGILGTAPRGRKAPHPGSRRWLCRLASL